MLPPNAAPFKPSKLSEVYKLLQRMFGEKWKLSEDLKYYQEASDHPPMNLDYVRDEDDIRCIDDTEDLKL
jgi:hypothetical protein